MNWAEILLGAVTVAIAVSAWYTSVEALHSAYRPVLRAVPLFVQATNAAVDPMRLLLKNIGRGPAVSVMIFEQVDSGPVLAAMLPLVEPPCDCPGSDPASRPGRARVEMDQGLWLEDDHTYRVLYQDIAAGWHETRFTTRADSFEVRMLGPYHRWKVWRWDRRIPQEARERAQVVRSREPL